MVGTIRVLAGAEGGTIEMWMRLGVGVSRQS
jgi:hypothetical protein